MSIRIRNQRDLAAVFKNTPTELVGNEMPAGSHKYRAIPTEYNGHKYPSRAQANRAAELDAMQLAGHVDLWLPEVPIFVGEPGIDKPFRVDFLVAAIVGHGLSTDGREIPEIRIHAEDVKGYETASFRRHVRQWKLRGPCPLHVIKRGETTIVEGADQP